MTEQWEKVIEHEMEFYINIQEYEDRLMGRLYESQMIRYPVTTFDEECGRVYLSCPNTEDQAIARIEAKEAVESLLKRAVKRINRLNNALAQLKEGELDVISIYYFEKSLSELQMSRALGFMTKKEFMEKKRKILKKLYSIYEAERIEKDKEFHRTLKEELGRKAYLFQQSALSNFNSKYKSII